MTTRPLAEGVTYTAATAVIEVTDYGYEPPSRRHVEVEDVEVSFLGPWVSVTTARSTTVYPASSVIAVGELEPAPSVRGIIGGG